MNQGELTLAVSKRFFLTQAEAGEIIKFILAEITDDLKKGGEGYPYEVLAPSLKKSALQEKSAFQKFHENPRNLKNLQNRLSRRQIPLL